MLPIILLLPIHIYIFVHFGVTKLDFMFLYFYIFNIRSFVSDFTKFPSHFHLFFTVFAPTVLTPANDKFDHDYI